MKGINGDIAFIKQGPAGKESAQNVPSVYLVKIDGGKVDEAVGLARIRHAALSSQAGVVRRDPACAACSGAHRDGSDLPGIRPGMNTRMDQLLQHALNALILGGTYALLGIGLTLIFGIMRVVNFTHGELYSFGAYMMYMWVMLAGVNFFLALVLAIAARHRAGRARSSSCCCAGCGAPTSTPPCW